MSRLWPDCGARGGHTFRLGLDEVDRQRVIRIEPVRAFLVHIPYREGGPERFDRLEIKQTAVVVGFPNNPPGPLKPVSVIKLKRVNDRRGPTQHPRQNSRIFDRHPGALCQIREGRMHRVPNQGGTRGAPIAQSGIDIECPAILFVPVRRINYAREYPRASHQSRLTAPTKDV